jgi:phage/plasmid-associated DNA primase
MVAGNQPVLPVNADSAISRRRITVCFNKAVPPKLRDPYLLEKLLQELPGILNWVLEVPPDQAISMLIDQARTILEQGPQKSTMSDPLAEWAEACLIADPEAHAYVGKAGDEADKLFPHHVEWCKTQGFQPEAHRRFSTRLVELLNTGNITAAKKRLGAGIVLTCVRIRTPDDPDDRRLGIRECSQRRVG